MFERSSVGLECAALSYTPLRCGAHQVHWGGPDDLDASLILPAEIHFEERFIQRRNNPSLLTE